VGASWIKGALFSGTRISPGLYLPRLPGVE